MLVATAPTAASCGGDDDARATTPTEISAPSRAGYAFGGRVGARYGGVDRWGMDAGRPARVVLTAEPTRVNSVDLSAGYADRSM